MYHGKTTSHVNRQRIAALPETVWSPFLNRVTRWSPLQMQIASAAVSHPELTQRGIAARVGCSQGTVSKTLAMMKRLAVLAVSTTRGRFGSTVAWVRAGVHRMIPPRSEDRVNPELKVRIDRSVRGGIIGRGGPALGIGDVLAGVVPARLTSR